MVTEVTSTVEMMQCKEGAGSTHTKKVQHWRDKDRDNRNIRVSRGQRRITRTSVKSHQTFHRTDSGPLK